jgi:hypothetical protein
MGTHKGDTVVEIQVADTAKVQAHDCTLMRDGHSLAASKEGLAIWTHMKCGADK